MGVFDVSPSRQAASDVGRGGHRGAAAAVTADVVALEPGAAELRTRPDRRGRDRRRHLRLPDRRRTSGSSCRTQRTSHAVADMIDASGSEPVDEWDRWAILAIQGPDSFELFDKVWPGQRSDGAEAAPLHDYLDVVGEEGHGRADRLHR